MTRPWTSIGLLVLPVLWVGLLIGVSFIATPVKFQAPSLELPVALDVGQVTFALFNRIEWALVVLLAFLALASGFPRVWGFLLGLVVVLLAVQSFWLLPELTARIQSIIAGQMPPPSSHHMLYAWAEAIKLVALLGMAGTAIWRLQRLKP